jgi:uncharacterized DUF497 family protein
MIIFMWDAWNVDHIREHGVAADEAEHIVRHALSPFPREIGNDKYMVWGQTARGRHIQVIFVYRSDDEIEYESLTLADVLAISENHADAIYVIHAMEMTPAMKRQFRRL